jgi:hypothetical protein
VAGWPVGRGLGGEHGSPRGREAVALMRAVRGCVMVVCEEVLAEHLQPLHGLSMRPLAQHARVQVLGERRVKSASEKN